MTDINPNKISPVSITELEREIEETRLPLATRNLNDISAPLRRRLDSLCAIHAPPNEGIAPQNLMATFSKVVADHSNSTALIRYYCLLSSMHYSLRVFTKNTYPERTVALFINNFERIMTTYSGELKGHPPSKNEFWKDLAITRLSCFPSYGAIYEMSSGFGRVRPLTAQITQIPSFLRMLKRLGGHAGYFEGHIHTPLAKDYQSGWKKRTLHIAEMLIAFPKCRGICGASWMEDPFLTEISPRLGKFRLEERNHGCYYFYLGRDFSGNALATSPTRRDLFKQGLYTPKLYLKVWGRKDILAWAAKNRIQ